MLRFLVAKFLRVIAVLLGATLIMFLLMHAIPGNPWDNYSSNPRIMVGLSIDKPMQLALERRFGLDLPLWRQYTRYIVGDFNKDGSFTCGVVCGNLGPSIMQRGRSVEDILFEPPEEKGFWQSRFGYSMRLVLLGSLIAVGLGIPLGILSAITPRRAVSHGISFGLAGMISIPNFVLGLLAIIVLASWLGITKVLPDWSQPRASIARVTRASLINILNEDYIRTARSKGLTETSVLLVHMLRNALAPILTFTGPILMEMFIGLLIIENLYAFPGFGSEYWRSVINLDYPVIMGLTLIYAIGIVLVNLVIGVVCQILDPRLRRTRYEGIP
jgi:oligopeptide transport system permease protein